MIVEQQNLTMRNSLSLGFEPIDAIHREFTECCMALAGASRETYLEKLDALISHSIAHFEQENEWMRTSSFPPAGCHISEHESVLNVLREVRVKVLEGDHEVGLRLAEELPKWFEHHIATMDRALADFLA
jgi:hemerythrin-like metal-binding protein